MSLQDRVYHYHFPPIPLYIMLVSYVFEVCMPMQKVPMAYSRQSIVLLFLFHLNLLTILSSSFLSGASYLPKLPFPYAYRTKGVMNVVDSCWRSNPNWATQRAALANCAIGFGSGAVGGKFGRIYVVTDPSDDPVNPKPGTLRYGAIQEEPLWITFGRDMLITPKNELMVTSHKTIDGRGARVEIAYGPCLTLQYVTNVIVHGISIHDCKQGKRGMVRSSTIHVGERLGSDGDAITVFGSSNIWIDHCYLARCYDGLIDVTHASKQVTITNNYFTQHNKVMLFGHNDNFSKDKIMTVTVAFNRFGTGLVQRMPRVRFGYAHVANNRYDEWEMYAVGGSANPTILSEGNYFTASNNPSFKQVTKRDAGGNWKSWKWRSSRDMFMNGAYFVQSGYGSCAPPYAAGQMFKVADGVQVPGLTSNAGPLSCLLGRPC